MQSDEPGPVYRSSRMLELDGSRLVHVPRARTRALLGVRIRACIGHCSGRGRRRHESGKLRLQLKGRLADEAGKRLEDESAERVLSVELGERHGLGGTELTQSLVHTLKLVKVGLELCDGVVDLLLRCCEHLGRHPLHARRQLRTHARLQLLLDPGQQGPGDVAWQVHLLLFLVLLPLRVVGVVVHAGEELLPLHCTELVHETHREALFEHKWKCRELLRKRQRLWLPVIHGRRRWHGRYVVPTLPVDFLFLERFDLVPPCHQHPLESRKLPVVVVAALEDTEALVLAHHVELRPLVRDYV
mmetsp:Transcript_19354/g.39404  ORF Transcript_19354/g.39404 Transcript_19354/m.39404 type:complete len:301 (-) Transcript_19354:73-975(-)